MGLQKPKRFIMANKRKDNKTLYVPCPIKVQREMLNKLCATASNKKTQEILVDLDKRVRRRSKDPQKCLTAFFSSKLTDGAAPTDV